LVDLGYPVPKNCLSCFAHYCFMFFANMDLITSRGVLQIKNMEGTKKILVVDDEPVLVDLLRAKLSQKGFNVVEAHDGEEGLNAALREHPDFILLDVIMPKVDGLTMLKRLREDEWGNTVPVLILSNLNTTEAVKKSQSGGVIDYLVKIDYTLEELADIVKEKLDNLEKRANQ